MVLDGVHLKVSRKGIQLGKKKKLEISRRRRGREKISSATKSSVCKWNF